VARFAPSSCLEDADTARRSCYNVLAGESSVGFGAEDVPRKIRELIADLEAAGFENRGGKGSHRNFVHPQTVKPVTISGKTGDDAKS